MARIERETLRVESRVRQELRTVDVRENRCQHCGLWFETRMRHARYCPQPKLCRVHAFRGRQATRRQQTRKSRPK